MDRKHSMKTTCVAEEIENYLRTGDTDLHFAAWPGGNFIEQAQRARADLRTALVAEVLKRTKDWQPPTGPISSDEVSRITRAKVEAMVRGLFPRAEQDRVLALVERSVVYLTPSNIEETLRAVAWPRSAWNIANLYLGAAGVDLLSEDAPQLVGISEHTTCYVSASAYAEDDPFSDFVVHEVAHIFHNCKRRDSGLKGSHRKEWLLDIDFIKREPFAYACEAYATVLRRAKRPAERRALAAELPASFGTTDPRVEHGEVAKIVQLAAERRNGWKAILEACASPKKTRGAPHARRAES